MQEREYFGGVIDGSTSGSPGFYRILDDYPHHKVDTLIVVSRDRLGKIVAKYLKCKINRRKRGVEILSADNIDSADSSMEEIHAAIAAYKEEN